jgi:thiol-disulfide isomerase/thioredoxin
LRFTIEEGLCVASKIGLCELVSRPNTIPGSGYSMIDWSNVFAEALSYGEFLDSHANQSQRERWDAMHARFALTPAQQGLLNAFTRRMPVICLTGAWCGDCINQCPVFDHLAQAAPVIELRFLDRDALPAVREELMINGGARVPVVVFLSEDWQEVSRYGERTLSIYRKLAADQLGPSCPTGLVPPTNEALATITAEWLAEFERAHLVLRLSPRLRSKHGD